MNALLAHLRLAIRALFRRSRVENDMEREMRFHIDRETDENVRRGMDPLTARREALIAFGGIERHKESARDERAARVLHDTISDLRYSVRGLLQHRGFALLAIGTLAIGLGIPTGVYTLVHWHRLRDIPGVEAPGRLAIVSFEDDPGQSTGFSAATLDRVRRDAHAFENVLGTWAIGVHLSGDGIEPRAAEGAWAGGDYFGTLGLRPHRGRFFTPDEQDPRSRAAVVVISHWLWTSQFGASADIVNRAVIINTHRFTVVGVAPRGFRGVERGEGADLWLPLGAYSALRHAPTRDAASPTLRMMFQMVGRLRAGATLTEAQDQVTRVAESLLAEDPQAFAILESHKPVVYDDFGTPIFRRDHARLEMLLMLGVAAVILLIACANVANLLLSRAVARRPELAIRTALGASRMRLLRLHVTEGLLIGVIAGALALAVAAAGARIFEMQFIRVPQVQPVAMGGHVFGLTFLLASVAGMLFGLLPDLVRMNRPMAPGADQSSRTVAPRAARLRNALAVIQVAGSVTLIAGALLLAQTVRRLTAIETGFDPRGLVIHGISTREQGYRAASPRLEGLRSRLLAALEAEPGITNAAIAVQAAPQAYRFSMDVRPSNASDDRWRWEADMVPVSRSWFETLGIPLLAGTVFLPRHERLDSAGPVPAIIDHATARRFFGTTDAIGRRLIVRTPQGPVPHDVIGVVGTARAVRPRAPATPTIYVPLQRLDNEYLEIVVRSPLTFAEVDRAVRRAVATADPLLPVLRVNTMQQLISRGTREERFFAQLVGLGAALAVLLATVGIYGLLAFHVTQRRREIGIRIALGARLPAVVELVTRSTMRLVGAGVAIGLAGALGLSRALESQLFGVPRLDFASFAGATILFSVASILAAIVPVRRAATVDPVESLRAH